MARGKNEIPDLGPCCVCGRDDGSARNIVMLKRRSPIAGAVAVLCDGCVFEEPIYVCEGLLTDRKRRRADAFDDKPFDHDIVSDTRIGDDLAWLDRVLDRANAHAEHLSDADINFVDSMIMRSSKYGADTFVSAKQRGWLEAVERRLDEAEKEEGGWD